MRSSLYRYARSPITHVLRDEWICANPTRVRNENRKIISNARDKQFARPFPIARIYNSHDRLIKKIDD